jgi:uncharacterized integral membrane protein (TIGR00698 family)
MKLTRNNLKYFSIILSQVALAYLVNRIEGAISPLFFAMVLGILMGNSMDWSAGKAAANFAAKRCLRLGVVFLGFQISIDKLIDVGPRGFFAVALIVIIVFLALRFFSKRFGVSDSLGTLIASGFAICGATAIAAVASARKSAEREISYAVALVALTGTLSVLVLPTIAKLIGLSDGSAGAWIGAAVHDVGQVIAAASLISPEALDSAVVIKLMRVLLLLPLVLFLARSQSISGSLRTATPIFVFGFLACAVLVNLFALPSEIINLGREISKILLSIGLFGIGLSVKWSQFRTLGHRPLIFGIAAWVSAATFTLAVVRAFGL